MTNEVVEIQPLDLHLYEVWRLPFEYDDQPGVFKQRPVIVGGIEESTIEVFVVSVKVTSHPPRPNFPGEVPLLDWAEAGLTKPSTARCSHVARVPKSYFEGRFKYGTLSKRDASAVEEALQQLGMVILKRLINPASE